MKSRLGLLCCLVLGASLAWASVSPLPTPQKSGGMPLLEALAKRATARSFSTKELPEQLLSNLLWAANGVNRTDGKRTAPSAKNKQETDLYLLTPKGAFLYQAKEHSLSLVLAEDIRALGGTQGFVKDAPLTLVFVADLSRMSEGPVEQRREWASLDVGFIAQNVYLFCASEGLATGARAWVDRESLGKRLGLDPDQLIILAQSVGYPGS